MTPPRILSLGEVLWDLFPEGARFGGAPANFACHAALRGGEVTMISAVGNDERGTEAVEILKSYGIDVGLVFAISEARTGTVGIELDKAGKPTFTIHEGSAWDQIPWSPDIAARLIHTDAVYFGTLGQRGATSRATIRRTLEVAAAADLPRVLDVNLRAPFYNSDLIADSIHLASILKLSDDELEEVCSAAGVPASDNPVIDCRNLRELFELDLVIMTRGSEGAVVVTPDETIDQPGIPTTVRDTVGAGDAFLAAFLLGYLARTPLQDVLENACEIASEVCAHDGAVPELKDSRRGAGAQSFLENSKEVQTA